MMLFKNKYLNKKQLVDLVIEVAYRKGLKPIGFRDIDRCYGTKELAVSVNKAGMIIVDREFIRIEDEKDDVSYAYVTQKHIDEVRRACSRAGSFTKIPTEIDVAFYAAEDAMKKSGKGYWINPEFENRIEDHEDFSFEI